MLKRQAISAPLAGYVIAISGNLGEFKYTQDSLKKLIMRLGGSVTQSVTKTTTHVVCSKSSSKGNSVKVAAGKVKNLPLVNPNWIFNAEKEKKRIEPQTYVWDSNKSAYSQTDGKKRSFMVPKSDEDKEPEVSRCQATKGAAKKAKATNPRLVAAKVEEDKEVAEGQFMKQMDAAIPVNIRCVPQPDERIQQQQQVLPNPVFDSKEKKYKTWTRWGRVGEKGQNALLGNGTVTDAVKFFEKKFKDKSGLTWDNRGNNPKPGKYIFVERSYNPDLENKNHNKGVVKKKAGEDVKPAKCTLQNEVKSLMELIFNQQHFQATMTDLKYDTSKLPLGKLSKATIIRGFQQLKELAALMDNGSLAASKSKMTVAEATEELSNLYYSIIPHEFGRKRPPVIRDNVALKKEIELLASLSDMKDAAEIMKIGRKSVNIHPLDKQFQSLGLNEMTVLDHNSQEFIYLSEYLHCSRGKSHSHNYTVQEIFRIERQGEKTRFEKYVKNSKIRNNRRLLWHGSRATNFGGILSQGLRIAPPEAPASGYMFGKGIYLADMSSKSANYCCSHISGGQALLLLCEAKLGNPMLELTNADYDARSSAKTKGFESTWGMGTIVPSGWEDAGKVHESLKGVQIPKIFNTRYATNVKGRYLQYNEYICYDIAQVKLRYLFRVQM